MGARTSHGHGVTEMIIQFNAGAVEFPCLTVARNHGKLARVAASLQTTSDSHVLFGFRFDFRFRFFKRASYAISRTFITKNDRGTNEFNISEIGGNASEAALSNLYYPAAERGFSKTAKNFATQTVITAGANVLKEFWPDIRKNLFRMKDEYPPRRRISE